jgi:hypothetical protein
VPTWAAVDVRPADIVIRLADCRPEEPRERSGMKQYGTYEVLAVRGDLLRLGGVGGWWPARYFDVMLAEPCA